MAHLEKIFEVGGFLIRTNFYIIADDPREEALYIDPLTKVYDENNNLLDKPIIEPIGFLMSHFFFYICPYCKKIHIDSTTNLNVDYKVLYVKCDKKHQGAKIQMKLMKLKLNNYIGLESEYNFMEDFENTERERKNESYSKNKKLRS